jgi:hypothetical protein
MLNHGKLKNGGKVTKVKGPQNDTYIEYCAMLNCGEGKFNL